MSDPVSPPPRSSNVALIISLCVNLLLAGLIAIPLVRFAFHGPFFGRPPMGDALGPRVERVQMHQMLSPRTLMHAAPDKADKIRSVLDSHRERIDALRDQSMAARRKVMDIFGAAAFNQAAFDKALADMQAADGAFEREILKVVSETAGTLSPEERANAAKWRPFRGRGHWRHGGPGGDRDGMMGPQGPQPGGEPPDGPPEGRPGTPPEPQP